ncbi:MAG: hypothetical protein ABW221_15125 [Vicinamibacteria bacterium]
MRRKPTTAVGVVLWAPVAATSFSIVWSWIASAALRGAAGGVDRLGFWAGDLPLLLFGTPAAAVWLWASIHSVWTRQGWQVLVLVAYYGALSIVAGLGMIVGAGLPVGDL